ncbi:C4-dicarboxylate TRAP transporter substrate-binding protein [Georgenia sp. Z1344]|uniref:C4-dicarboxylate TRAP transporter substrate-binding protein n=1 Tax=Georgenia sp. Z1344 TaxID=3416706 RepID=UPI003CEDC70A
MTARASRRRPVSVIALAGVAASLGLAACGGSGGADGDEEFVLHYTTYSNATSDQSRTVQRWAEEVEELTDGGVRVEFHYSESLVGADESVQATLDGRADLAQVGSLYAASDLSMYTVSELPFETENPEAHMRTLARMFEEDPVYREDFDRQGVRQLFPLPLASAVVGVNEPVSSLDDLAGRSIRAGGLTSEVMLAAGANPVAMTATDVYESMERGVIGGYTSLALANLPTFGLSDVTPYILDPGIGAYGSSIVVVNEELFDSMPAEYQDALLTASGHAVDNGLEELGVLADEACADLRESDAEFTSLPDEDVAEWRELAGADDDWVDRYSERGYDAAGVLERYRRIIAEETEASSYVDPLHDCMGEAS